MPQRDLSHSMNLSIVLQHHRHTRREGLRQFAKRLGVDYTALHRFESGRPLDQKNLLKVIKWLLS
jgi:hypothetical protein